MLELWARLNAIRTLQFRSESRSCTGWNGVGNGVVNVVMASANSLIFMESGQWQQNGGNLIRFSNRFRWSKQDTHLRLEHLRFGCENPVFLFDMAPDESGVWRDVKPHPCRDDCYSATLELGENRLLVNWSVQGPTKDESIGYVYS